MHKRLNTDNKVSASKDGSPTSSCSRHSPFLTKLLKWDEDITRKCSWYASAHDPSVSQMRTRMKWLEWSCHGIPCLSSALVFLWFAQDSWYQQFLLNVLLALLVDIIAVATVKAITRRRRPSNNHADMFGAISVDKYAFPSGHAVRAILLSLIFCYQGEVGPIMSSLSFIWAIGVCTSRVLLGRHHVGDVAGGILQGILEYFFMSFIWLDVDSAKYILKVFKTFESFHVLDGGPD